MKMYSEPSETIELENQTVEIYVDGDPINPREWDNLGTMVCWHSRYNLGDKHEMSTPQQALVSLAESVIEPYHEKVNGWYTHELWEWAAYDNIPNDKESGYPLDALNDLVDKHFIVLPLYLYDHSGITMNTSGFSCSWDSGQVGFIYVSKERIRKEYNWKNLTKKRIAKIVSYLENEVEIYDYFLVGSCYGYHLICKDCGEELDTCWGFYGENWKGNGLLDYAEDFTCQCQTAKVFQNAGVGL